MIEKLDLDKRHSFGTLDWLEHWNEPSGAKLIENKINELVDTINKQDEVIKLLIEALERLAESQQEFNLEIEQILIK